MSPSIADCKNVLVLTRETGQEKKISQQREQLLKSCTGNSCYSKAFCFFFLTNYNELTMSSFYLNT